MLFFRKVSLRLNDKHFELDKSVMEIREFDEIVHGEKVYVHFTYDVLIVCC